VIKYAKIQATQGVREYLAQRIVPDSTFRNWNSYSDKVAFDKSVNVMEAFNLLPDPQTNGGLLIAVQPEAVAAVQQLFRENQLDAFLEPIGVFTKEEEKRVRVV
jgi:selenide,water dikinase